MLIDGDVDAATQIPVSTRALDCTSDSDPGCAKTASRLFVSAQFAEAIDEAVH
jgi:hypothetical protein